MALTLRGVLLDPEDLYLLELPGWYIGRDGAQLYVKREYKGPDGKRVRERLHRKVMGVTGRLILVDHKNMNGLDNRRENLRVCDKSGNMCNRGKPRTNKSGYKGVGWHKGGNCWQAYISKDGVRHYLGLFQDPVEAHRAYCDAAARLHGEYARTL